MESIYYQAILDISRLHMLDFCDWSIFTRPADGKSGNELLAGTYSGMFDHMYNWVFDRFDRAEDKGTLFRDLYTMCGLHHISGHR